MAKTFPTFALWLRVAAGWIRALTMVKDLPLTTGLASVVLIYIGFTNLIVPIIVEYVGELGAELTVVARYGLGILRSTGGTAEPRGRIVNFDRGSCLLEAHASGPLSGTVFVPKNPQDLWHRKEHVSILSNRKLCKITRLFSGKPTSTTTRRRE